MLWSIRLAVYLQQDPTACKGKQETSLQETRLTSASVAHVVADAADFLSCLVGPVLGRLRVGLALGPGHRASSCHPTEPLSPFTQRRRPMQCESTPLEQDLSLAMAQMDRQQQRWRQQRRPRPLISKTKLHSMTFQFRPRYAMQRGRVLVGGGGAHMPRVRALSTGSDRPTDRSTDGPFVRAERGAP